MKFDNISIAVLSDIHGNSWALETVLEDIRLRSPDLIINLGDSLYGPLNPSGSYDLISKSRMISISGNEDRLILDKARVDSQNNTLTYVRDQLTEDAFKWLESLNSEAIYPSLLYACHGSPHMDNQYLLHKAWNGIVIRRGNSEICNIIGDLNERIILCGHSHIPEVVETGGKILINPGSVGCPAFSDINPYHIVECASPRSNYCILTISDHRTRIEQISLEYDYHKASETAEQNKRPDWAGWLRSGFVEGEKHKASFAS